jgi:hypothetical protein
MKAKYRAKTSQSRTRTRPARPVGADCDTWPVYSASIDGCVERDLDGRLFFVEREELGGCGYPYYEVSRREIGYREAVAFIANHSWWKHPWKVLAHHGIKAPSTTRRGRRARPGRRSITP